MELISDPRVATLLVFADGSGNGFPQKLKRSTDRTQLNLYRPSYRGLLGYPHVVSSGLNLGPSRNSKHNETGATKEYRNSLKTDHELPVRDLERLYLSSYEEFDIIEEDNNAKDYQRFLDDYRLNQNLNDGLVQWEQAKRGEDEYIEGFFSKDQDMSELPPFVSPRLLDSSSPAFNDGGHPRQFTAGSQGRNSTCEMQVLGGSGKWHNGTGREDLYRTQMTEEFFLDSNDGIRVLKVHYKSTDTTHISWFNVFIPKHIMHSMPPPPDDLLSPPELEADFSIQVQIVEVQNISQVDDSIDWLLWTKPTAISVVCKHGPDGFLSLIQLCAHERCVLIRVSQASLSKMRVVSLQLQSLLSGFEVTKVGASLQKDALAIFYFLGIMTNNCLRVSQFSGSKRRKTILELCRELFHWEWSENKKVILSNWASKNVSIEQVKHAVLDAWTTRLIWIGQTELWNMKPQPFSLAEFPWTLLDYFGRSLFSFELQSRKDEDTSIEVRDAAIEIHQGYLSLRQKHFKSRVMGPKSVVELHFKDGRRPQKYVTLYCEGNRVILDNAEPSSTIKAVAELQEEITMTSKVLVDNRNNHDTQKQKLEEYLYLLLCVPGLCPRHILAALQCAHPSILPSNLDFDLEKAFVQSCKVGLNPGQSDAWHYMLSSPLSAVIGPPGTGKTTVITAVVKAWLKLAALGETLVCAAHQNVVVRHMAETMLQNKVPGIVMLVSEDYYVGWHEDEYSKEIKDLLIVTGSQTTASLQSWVTRNGNQPPRVLLCTLALIGNDSFHASLMNNRVSALIIDECSQAGEGCLIPALGTLPHLRLLSVVGDPCQLPPYGFRPVKSVFDLLAQSCSVKLLQEQYRMPYRIAQFVSAEFYGGRLHTNKGRMLKDLERPLVWVDVKGTADATSGTSLSNQEEAKAVVEWCKVWKKKHGGLAPRGMVVVLTLYEAQRSLVNGMLDEAGLSDEIIAYNVDSFQGQEADIVIISLVVGTRVSGFAANRRRACVLLSRAKKELLLFGNLKTIQCHSDNIWKRLARYCEIHDWVVSRCHLKSLF